MVYMAADNDLSPFAVRNIRQMTSAGSNENINIIVHLDIKTAEHQKITRFYYIEKNKIIHLNVYDQSLLPMDSGDPQTLITFCKTAVEYFPAQHYALILWNHGTGALSPEKARIANPSLLFNFNPTTNKLELDRSISYLDFVSQEWQNSRGICWDDSTGNFLTNAQLASALKVISAAIGKKIDILGFDACLMAMVEIAYLAKDSVEIMVASQEVELGTGWNYFTFLYPALKKPFSSKEFAERIVSAYHQSYNAITNDYTLSAVDLQFVADLEKNIDAVSSLLLQTISLEKDNSVRRAILKSRDRRYCTYFDEPSYIDIHDFYKNLLSNSKDFKFTNKERGTVLTQNLVMLLNQGIKTIEKSVIANTCGKNLKNARGISIYYPLNARIHSSYKTSNFFMQNQWGNLIRMAPSPIINS